MSARTDSFDLGRLNLVAGQGRRFELDVAIDPLKLSGQAYAAQPTLVAALFDVSRMTGAGYSLRLRFQAVLAGPCMRCLDPAQVPVDVDAREVDQPGAGEELDSPYVSGEVVDVRGWARDALALAMPVQLLCRADCAGLCPLCGANLNREPDHAHDRPADPRWEKLRELKFDR